MLNDSNGVPLCGAENPDYPGEYSCTFLQGHGRVLLPDRGTAEHGDPDRGAYWSVQNLVTYKEDPRAPFQEPGEWAAQVESKLWAERDQLLAYRRDAYALGGEINRSRAKARERGFLVDAVLPFMQEKEVGVAEVLSVTPAGYDWNSISGWHDEFSVDIACKLDDGTDRLFTYSGSDMEALWKTVVASWPK